MDFPLALTSPLALITITLGFFLASYSVEYYIVSWRKSSFQWAQNAALYNNRMFGIFSGIFAVGMWLESQNFGGLCFLDCNERLRIRESPNLSNMFYLFYLSKIYEFMDVLLVALSHSEKAIGAHFRIHHITTLSVVWMTIYYEDSVPNCIFATVISNAGHHFFMYLCFGGVQLFRPVMFLTGTVQLVCGILCATFSLQNSTSDGWNTMYVLLMYLIYFLCWMNDLRSVIASKHQKKA